MPQQRLRLRGYRASPRRGGGLILRAPLAGLCAIGLAACGVLGQAARSADDTARLAAEEAARARAAADDAAPAAPDHPVPAAPDDAPPALDVSAAEAEREARRLAAPYTARLALSDAREVVLYACAAKDITEIVGADSIEEAAQTFVVSFGGTYTFGLRVSGLAKELDEAETSGGQLGGRRGLNVRGPLTRALLPGVIRRRLRGRSRTHPGESNNHAISAEQESSDWEVGMATEVLSPDVGLPDRVLRATIRVFYRLVSQSRNCSLGVVSGSREH